MRRSLHTVLPAALACALFLLACSGSGFPFVLLASPTPTATLPPIATATPPATQDLPSLELGEVHRMGAAGFTYQSPAGYMAMPINGFEAVVFRDEAQVDIYLDHWWSQEPLALDEFLSSLLDTMAVDDLHYETPVETRVDGVAALTTDMTWMDSGQLTYGRVTAASQGEAGFFTVFLIARDAATFEGEGRAAMQAVVSSVRLFEPELTRCAVATDPTYGYDESNAVRVGGGVWDGPAREEAYLSVLAGPGGETITYDRQGSTAFGDTILDIYAIHYANTTAILYVDEYNWEPPQAPVGFTCLGDFPLSAP